MTLLSCGFTSALVGKEVDQVPQYSIKLLMESGDGVWRVNRLLKIVTWARSGAPLTSE